MESMSLPTALAAARGDRSQAAIAEDCGVSQATISSWESGETRPRYDRLRIVAKAFGMPLRRLRALWISDADRRVAA